MHVRARDARVDLARLSREAARLRREIARLFDAKPPRHIVLAPGILSALRQLFSSVGVERLVLSTDEYYAPRHFPGIETARVSCAALSDRIRSTRPDAVLVSVVSWQGRPLPVAELFAQVRHERGRRAPLLVADYTHAGAIGFPPVRSLNADLVCGDPAKWLLPAAYPSRLAFLWLRSSTLVRTSSDLFAPLFLAIEGRPDPQSARWIDPAEVHAATEWLLDARLTRRVLLARHHANLGMKQALAKQLGLDAGGATSVLWTDKRIPRALARRLERGGLIWRAAGHTRILCRAK